MVVYHLETGAYVKLALHAYKYPHLLVNGVLLARKDGLKDGTLTIADVVPLFHGVLNLSAMLEVALSQVDLHAQERGMRVVGYYVVNDSDETTVDAASSRIADAVADALTESLAGKACILVPKSSSLGIASNKPEFETYTRSDSRWKTSPDVKTICDNGAHSAVKQLVVRRSPISLLVDFDDHLDDVARDWTNGWVAKEIQAN